MIRDALEPNWRTDEPPKDRFILAVFQENGEMNIVARDVDYREWGVMESDIVFTDDIFPKGPLKWAEMLFPTLFNDKHWFVSLSNDMNFIPELNVNPKSEVKDETSHHHAAVRPDRKKNLPDHSE